jgi:hypothetical protein
MVTVGIMAKGKSRRKMEKLSVDQFLHIRQAKCCASGWNESVSTTGIKLKQRSHDHRANIQQQDDALDLAEASRANISIALTMLRRCI